MYAPIAARVIRERSADGLSPSTFCLYLAGYGCSACYSRQRGFPLNTYFESVSLAAQTVVLLGLIAALRKIPAPAAAAAALAYGGAFRYLGLGSPPRRLLSALQFLSIALCNGAIMPQLLLNRATQSGGQWSPVTAGLALAGSGVRVFTTLRLTKDPLLLAGFCSGACLNGLLLGQILAYGPG